MNCDPQIVRNSNNYCLMETLRAQIEPLLDSSIGLDRFEHPVVAADGQSYEKEEIEDWFKSSSSSPSTGLTLPSKKVYRNCILEQLIEWFEDSKTTTEEPEIFERHLDRLREILIDGQSDQMIEVAMVLPDGLTYDADSLTEEQAKTAYSNQVARQLLDIYRSHRPRKVSLFDPTLLETHPKSWSALFNYIDIPLNSWADGKPLLDRVFTGRVTRRLITHLITHGREIWSRDNRGRQLIHYLASRPELADLAIDLITKRTRTGYRDEFDANGKSPSMYAIEAENIELLIAYHRSKWKIKMPPYLGDLLHTTVTYAMVEKKWTLLNRLLGSYPGIVSEFKRGFARYGKTVYSAHHLAAEIAPWTEFMVILDRAGHDLLNSTDESGRSVLYIAMLFRSHYEIEMLLENNRVEVVPKRCCIEHGVSAECLNPFCSALEDNRQLTPEQKDSIRGRFATADRVDRGQFLPPFAFTQLRRFGGDDRTKFLAQIVKDSSRIYGRRSVIAAMLLDPVWRTDRGGRDALIARIWESKIHTWKSLGGRQFTLDLDHFGENTMHTALRTSATQLLFEMFEIEVELVPDRQGNTPLLLACRFADEPVILTLIELSPPDHLTTPNRDGCVPLDFAVQRKMETVAEALTARLERI